MKQLALLLVVLSLSACGGGSAITTCVPSTEIVLGTMRDRDLSFLLGYTRQVYLLNPDGSGESSKKSLWTSMDKPIWSPNGQWVAFDNQYTRSTDGGSAIYVAKGDGSQSQRVSYSDGTPLDFHPSWSPDGTHIAYESHIGIQYGELYVLDIACILDGTPCNFSPTSIAKGGSPAWSPDGTQIAFVIPERVKDNYYSSIHVISADGIGDTTQVSPSHLSCDSPQWSPTGAAIMFTCYNRACCSQEEAGIYKVDPDGENFELISNIAGWDAQWSPEGSKIAFISDHDADLGKMIGWESGWTRAVYIIDADGTGLTRLSLRSDEDVYWFTWFPVCSRE